MGIFSSKIDLQSRGNTSYYGETGGFGDIDGENIQETLRNLQLERLYQRSPHIRPSNNQKNQKVNLKTFINISEIYIRQYDSLFCIYFLFSSDVKGKILINSNGEINSKLFSPCKKQIHCLPIPNKTDFFIEISPKIDNIELNLKPNYLIINKHILNFKIIQVDNHFIVSFIDHELFSNNQSFKIENKQIIEIQQQLENNPCLFCNENNNLIAISECGHKILCENCLEKFNAHCNHCPFCNLPSNF